MRRSPWLFVAVALALTLAACVASDGKGSISTETPSTTTTLTPTTTQPISTKPSVVTTTVTRAERGSLPVAEGAAGIRNVLISGDEKAAAVLYRDHPTTYQPPETALTQVGRVRFRDDATLDIYYPPSYAFDERLPAVVFINAWSTTQDTVLLFPDGTPMDESLGTDDY